ncbi:MAG: hypothetical protein JO224_05590 [Pelomonas sp.]|nr:hypothetical protein [Roseateles sp.]
MRRGPIQFFALLFPGFGLLAACTPALNWREVQPAGSHLSLTFPCKPDVAVREVAGLRQGLAQCDADGASFVLAWSELRGSDAGQAAATPDPGAVDAALRDMRASVAARLHATAGAPRPFGVAGMDARAEAQVQDLEAPGPRHARVASFARGALAYELVVISARPVRAVAWDGFTGLMRLSD